MLGRAMCGGVIHKTRTGGAAATVTQQGPAHMLPQRREGQCTRYRRACGSPCFARCEWIVAAGPTQAGAIPSASRAAAGYTVRAVPVGHRIVGSSGMTAAMIASENRSANTARGVVRVRPGECIGRIVTSRVRHEECHALRQ